MTAFGKYCATLGAVVLLLISCRAEKIHSEQIERGGQWLSWSRTERHRFIHRYLDGFLRGRNRACDAADHLFEVGQPHRLGDGQHPNDMPSTRCFAALDDYSRARHTGSDLDFSAYADPITEFYTKHPEYQGVPFPFLMDFLSDKKCNNAEQLYQKALAGELRVIRQR